MIGDQAVAAERYETFRMWQHLANAGLIEGSYSGVTFSGAATTIDAEPGINVPKGRLGGTSGFNLFHIASYTGNACWWDGEFGPMLQFGGNSSGSTATPILAPEEAWNMDIKLDDGRPAYGTFRAAKGVSCGINAGCTTTDVASTSEYTLSNNAKLCTVIYRMF